MAPELTTVGGDQSLQELRRELAEAREQQATTAEILRVISSAPTDSQRVFAEIAASAGRLCDASDAAIHQVHGDVLRLVAGHGSIPKGDDTLPLTREVVTGRAVLDRQTIQVADVQAETDEYPVGSANAQRLGHRTLLAVPLMRSGQAIGVIGIRRTEVRQFTDRQIELLKIFADQAVIAIENTRLFEEVQARQEELEASTKELQETLEYQTATSDILSVISRSPNELQPVLNAIVSTAFRLCPSDRALVMLPMEGGYRAAARAGVTPPEVEERMSQGPVPVDRGSVFGRVVQEGRTIHVADVRSDGGYTLMPSLVVDDRRTVLGVPLLREGEVAGVIVLLRTRVEPYTQRQIELIETFADQAVIAMSNARLFEEVQARTRELAKTVEDLEIASQHKSQFVANMSHELRTPLAAMLGYAELLHEGIYGTLPEKSLPILTRIRSNGKHLLGLINTVLDIAKIESGQFNLNLGEYALDGVIETVRAATEALAETKKLSLKTEVAKSLPIGLGDEQRLTQVLLNLVGNAIKFTDTGEVRIAATTANGHFAVSVADTGPGIPQEHQARIFEQFHQVDSSNTKAKGGTGLGLAIAREIVEMHGGRIWVESTLGQGSTFRMELPVRAPIAIGAT
jgi:signal transduction histidine kinase